jgi:hypothetical protein
MEYLQQRLLTLYPQLKTDADSWLGDIVIQNDGQGDYIKSWSHPTLAQPTEEQLLAVEPDFSLPPEATSEPHVEPEEQVDEPPHDDTEEFMGGMTKAEFIAAQEDSEENP